jgi:hypothetical protein
MHPYNGHGDDITIDIDPAKVFSESDIPHWNNGQVAIC